jgi:O-antigen ligase
MLQIALVAFGLLFAAASARQRCTWVLLTIFVLCCAALAATLTRASLVSLLVAAVVVAWIAAPRAWLRTAAIVGVIAGLALVSVWVRRERGLGLVARNDAGTQYRVLMWEDGIRLARQHPLLGVGMDSIKARWQPLGIRAYQRFPIKSHFHSTPIQIAAERGLPALLTWAALMAVYLRLGLQLWRRSLQESWWVRGISLGIFGASVGFLCSGFVHYNLGDSEVQMLFWFLMGTALALERILPRARPVPASQMAAP